MRITRTRLQLVGAHEHLTIWIDGASVGTLVLGEGQGRWVQWILRLGVAAESGVTELDPGPHRRQTPEEQAGEHRAELARMEQRAGQLVPDLDEPDPAQAPSNLGHGPVLMCLDEEEDEDLEMFTPGHGEHE